LISFRLKES